MSSEDVRENVRKAYGEIALLASEQANDCCGPGACGPDSQALGYSIQDLASLPEGADLGLGCGNPRAIAELQDGETVVDLGSGGGIDCFLAAQQVGLTGHVIGIDMTPAMLTLARTNATKLGITNVEFRQGTIEDLPISDASVDVIISNCVVNLSPDKPDVFAEAYRVLKTGGRLAISDIVALEELPDEIRNDPALYSGCIGGAETKANLEDWLQRAGFEEIRITREGPGLSGPAGQEGSLARWVMSATIEAIRPFTEHQP